jgi:hypothetical protein
MRPTQVMTAIQNSIDIATKNIDELNIKVTVFGSNYVTWPGIHNDHMPGWTALPSEDAINSLRDWFNTVSLDTGDTFVNGALSNALQEDIDETIIILSDFIISDMSFYDENRPGVVSIINAARISRRHPITFGAIIIWRTDSIYPYTEIVTQLCIQIDSWLVIITARPSEIELEKEHQDLMGPH